MPTLPARPRFAALISAVLLLNVSSASSTPPPRPWTKPLDAPLVVTRGFAPGAHDWLPGHRGVDLLAVGGATVRSAGAGIVTFAGVLAGRGVVSVTHGSGISSLRTTYEPLSPRVAVGQAVATGTALGLLVAGHGGSGRPVLHWGLRRGPDYLDPMTLLSRGPVRLLPRWSAPGVPPASTMTEPITAPVLVDGGGPGPAPAGRRGRPRAGIAAVAGLAGLALTARRAHRRSA